MDQPKDMEPIERLIRAAWLGTKDPSTRKRLGQEALKLLTVENLAVFAVVLAVYVLGSAVTAPWSVIVNGVLAGVGLIAFGSTVLKTAPSLISFARVGWYAQTEADLQKAAKHFADGLVAVGPDVIITILGASSFGLLRRVVLARLKLPKLVEPKPQPKATPPKTEPSAPKTEPAAPKTEPAQPKTEPAQPKTEPAQPKTEPSAPKREPAAPKTGEPGKPSTLSRIGAVGLDLAAGAGAGQLATGLKPWHILAPLGVVGAVGAGVLLLRSGRRSGS